MPALSLVVLKTPELERLKAFFETLGLPLAAEQHGAGPQHYTAALGEVVLELYPSDGPVDTSVRLGFTVTDLPAVLAALLLTGTPVLRPPHHSPWGLRACVHDPDGRSVELYQRAEGKPGR
jgi:predicted enzyme related to lactoylglutathione lyase